MADATVLPTYANNKFFLWNAKLTNSLDASTADTTIYWDKIPEDSSGQITGSFLIAVKNTRRSPNNVELMWAPAASVSADGLSGTVVRGLDPSGLDYTTGSADYVYSFDSGDEVFCAILPQDGELIRAAMQGIIATGGSNFIIGTDADGTVTVSRSTGTGTYVGWIRWSTVSDKAEFSNDGITWNSFDSVTASNLVVVTSSDTTPSNLNAKVTVTDGRLTKTVLNPAGNETLDLTLTTTSSNAELNKLTGTSANVTAANLNTLTAGPTSDASALHTHGAFPISLTTLEAIDGSVTPQYVAYGSANMKDRIAIYDTNGVIAVTTGTNRNIGSVDAFTWLAQSFVYTDALASSIKVNDLTVILRTQGTPTGNISVEIQADSGGAPSGTTITNGTSDAVSGGSLSTSYRAQKFTWATPPTLTSGTTYWLVFKRSVAVDAVNYFQILDAGGSTYANGTLATYTASTLSWSNVAADMKMQLVLNVSYGGKVCKCDADNVCRSNGFGFITENASAAASASVYYDHHVSYSGLTDGSTYVASTTGGALVVDSSSPTNVDISTPTPHVVAGTVVADKVVIGKYKRIVFTDDKITAFTAVANTSFDLLVPVGFRPDEITLKYSYNDASASANALGHSVERRYSGLTDQGGTFITEGNASSATATLISTGSVTAANLSYGKDTTSPWAGAVTLQAIYDNAILVRLTLDATADVLGLQSIECVKY